ncbi:MAG: hypothetical protein QM736_18145 [Vicinamibacterales bacterium]
MHAALGEFEKAIAVARTGVEVAEGTGQSLLAADMRGRLDLYVQQKPFVR